MGCDEAYDGECCDSSCASPADVGIPVITSFRLQLGLGDWSAVSPGHSDLPAYLCWADVSGQRILIRVTGGVDPNPPDRGALKPGRWTWAVELSGFTAPNLQHDELYADQTLNFVTYTGGPQVGIYSTGSLAGNAVGGALLFPTPGPPGNGVDLQQAAAGQGQFTIPCEKAAHYILLYYLRVRSDPSVPGTIVFRGDWISDPP